jgi:hypothetical protein
MVPNFAVLDASQPDIARLVQAMVQAREAVENRSWSHPQEPTTEEWWADVLADTLRAYPSTYCQYPLLNPRFKATEADLDEHWDKECLELSVWSKGESNGLRRYLGYLEKFRSTKDCAFLGLEEPWFSGDYLLHLCGWFVMPLRFLGHGPNVKIDFTGLTESLRRILIFLRKAPSFGAAIKQ